MDSNKHHHKKQVGGHNGVSRCRPACVTPEITDPCGEKSCGEFDFQGPAILYGFDLFHDAQVYMIIGGVKKLVKSIRPNSEGYHQTEFELCGDYVMEWCVCEDENLPEFYISDFNPSANHPSSCHHTDTGHSVALPAQCFKLPSPENEPDVFAVLTPVIIYTGHYLDTITQYYREDATLYEGELAITSANKCC